MDAKKKGRFLNGIRMYFLNSGWVNTTNLKDDQVIDITKVDVLDTNSLYVMIPKLADSHKLLREDVDIDYSDGSATDNLT